MRIMVLGKTGVGKSGLANTICGVKETFKESASPNSETKKCWAVNATVCGRDVRVIDTPGFFDTDLNSTEQNSPKPDSTEQSDEILRCIKDCAPGPHAFLIVLEAGRFTPQEQEVVDITLKFFSEDALQFTSVVFTHGDQLPEDMKIKDWAFQNKALKTLIQKCGGRVHVFDNKYWNDSRHPYRNNQVQVQELLNSIEQKNGKYYTNKYLEFLLKYMEEIRSRVAFAARVLFGALVGSAGLASVLFETLRNSRRSANEDARFDQQEQETDALRIVLLGRSGSGKSSLGNTIFGDRECFTVLGSTRSSTVGQSRTRRVHGRNIQLIDTPGIFNTELNNSELKSELLRCIKACAPGPHAFLLVLQVGRFTSMDQEMVHIILNYFSEDVYKYTTVVFTHGDDLDEEIKIEDWFVQNKALESLVQKCGGRAHVFDNRFWNNSRDPYRNNQVQVQMLLNTIDQTVRQNRGGYYTNETFQQQQTNNQQQPKSFFRWIFGL